MKKRIKLKSLSFEVSHSNSDYYFVEHFYDGYLRTYQIPKDWIQEEVLRVDKGFTFADTCPQEKAN